MKRFRAIHHDAHPKHVSRCHRGCNWEYSFAARPDALAAAAEHVEATGHTVCVRAVDFDWIVPVPPLPEYEARRSALSPESNPEGER